MFARGRSAGSGLYIYVHGKFMYSLCIWGCWGFVDDVVWVGIGMMGVCV